MLTYSCIYREGKSFEQKLPPLRTAFLNAAVHACRRSGRTASAPFWVDHAMSEVVQNLSYHCTCQSTCALAPTFVKQQRTTNYLPRWWKGMCHRTQTNDRKTRLAVDQMAVELKRLWIRPLCTSSDCGVPLWGFNFNWSGILWFKLVESFISYFFGGVFFYTHYLRWSLFLARFRIITLKERGPPLDSTTGHRN